MDRTASAMAVCAALLLTGCNDKDATTDTAGLPFDWRVSDGNHEAESPRTCMDEAERIHVVWADDRDGETGIFYNRSGDAGETWMSSSIQINQPQDGGEALNPDIACVGDNVYVVWEDLRDGELRNGNIYFIASDDAGLSWPERDINLDLDPDGDTISKAPRIAAGNDGVYVVWVDDRNGAYDVFVQISTNNGGKWLEEVVRVDSDEAGDAWSGSPAIATSGNGEVLVAWEDLRNEVSDIFVNRSSDHGRSWDRDTQLSTGTQDSFAPRLIMDNGHAYVAWHDQVGDSDVRDVYLSHSDDNGETWPASPTRPEANAEGFYDAYYPSISAIGQYLHIAWQDDRSGGFDIYYRRSADGGATWYEEDIRLDRDAAGSAQSTDVRLLADQDGLVVAVWQDYRNDVEVTGVNDLYYIFSDDGGETWKADDYRVLANEAGTSYAVDTWLGRKGGDLFFTWADGRFGNTDVFFTKLGLGKQGGEI